jgi:hypothetical protein
VVSGHPALQLLLLLLLLLLLRHCCCRWLPVTR